MGWIFRSVVLLVVWLVSSVVLDAAPAPAPSCTVEIEKLSACLSFVNGQDKTPQPACCDALPGVLSEAPICLCELLGYGNSSLPVPPGFNVTLAKELPGLCKVNADPNAICPALVNGTTSSPIPSPSPTTEGPTSPGTPGSGGTPAPETGGPSSNDGRSKTAFPTIFSCLIAVLVTTIIPLVSFVDTLG